MFNFRLQRVLELRAQHEQAKARELASAQDAAELARQAHELLARTKADSRAQIAAAQTGATLGEAPRVGHLQGLGMTLDALEHRLEAAGETRKTAEHQVDEAQRALVEAARERRILDRLKEKHAEVWRTEEAQRDRVQMDEIALARFARSREKDEDAATPSEKDTRPQ